MDTNPECSYRLDRSSEVSLVFRRANQCLGVVDAAKQQFYLLSRESRESRSSRPMVRVGTVEGGDHHIGVKHA